MREMKTMARIIKIMLALMVLALASGGAIQWG